MVRVGWLVLLVLVIALSACTEEEPPEPETGAAADPSPGVSVTGESASPTATPDRLTTASPPDGIRDVEGLEAVLQARQAWDRLALDDYTYILDRECGECDSWGRTTITVEDGGVVEVDYPEDLPTGYMPTISDLLEEIENYLRNGGVARGVYTDEGVPRGVFVDAMPPIVLDNGQQQYTEDDEVTLTAWLLRDESTPTGSPESEDE